jgi:hypothetical protein
MLNITRVGVDIAKSVFHVHGVDRQDHAQWRGKYARGKWLDALVMRVPVGAEIGMEACASAHYWARELRWWFGVGPSQAIEKSTNGSTNGAIFRLIRPFLAPESPC